MHAGASPGTQQCRRVLNLMESRGLSGLRIVLASCLPRRVPSVTAASVGAEQPLPSLPGSNVPSEALAKFWTPPRTLETLDVSTRSHRTNDL